MDRLNTVLSKVLQRRGLHGQATASMIVHQAQEWLVNALPQFARDLRVLHIKDGTLAIASANSIAAQECQQVVPLLKEYLIRDCKHAQLESIQIMRERAG